MKIHTEEETNTELKRRDLFDQIATQSKNCLTIFMRRNLFYSQLNPPIRVWAEYDSEEEFDLGTSNFLTAMKNRINMEDLRKKEGEK